MGFLPKMIILGCFGGTTIFGNTQIHIETVYLDDCSRCLAKYRNPCRSFRCRVLTSNSPEPSTQVQIAYVGVEVKKIFELAAFQMIKTVVSSGYYDRNVI